MALLVLLILMSSQIVLGDENKLARDGLIDRLSNGMKFATEFLGSESVALKVAEFVVRAFQNTNKQGSSQRRPYHEAYTDKVGSEEEILLDKPAHPAIEAPLSPLKYLVRLFGLQPTQISAVAVNALVFVAQMISTFLAGNRRPSQPYRSDDPSSWILNKRSRKLQELISKAKNESLFDDIQEIIKTQSDDEETSCIQLLVCKITPFVHKMQKAVFGPEDDTRDKFNQVRGAAAMYRHLPTEAEINARSDICEKRHRDCDLNE